MSMVVVLIKLTSDFHRRIVESEGQLLSDVGDGLNEEGFDPANDTNDQLDYRDISLFAENAEHPLYELFHDGEILHEDYEWEYGHPAYFEPDQVVKLSNELRQANDEEWQIKLVADFLGRAAHENKGVILGVT